MTREEARPYSPETLAEHWDCSVSHIKKMLRSGALRGFKIGTMWRKAFREACARARIVGVTPHTLRHTAACWMAEAGIDMERIAQYLGHSDPATTRKHYAKFAPDWLADAASALEG